MNTQRSNLKIFAPSLILILLTACGRGQPEVVVPDSSAPFIQEEPIVPEESVFVGDVDEIVFYNRPDYIDPEIYALFQDEFEIEVTEDNFTTNERMLSRVRGLGSAESYALIVPSEFNAAVLISEGMLAELNHNNIPNLANLSDRFRQLPYDPGNRYCVPYQWGMTGLAYHAEAMTEPLSWQAIFQPEPSAAWYGRTTMLDDARQAFAAALIYLGHDVNASDQGQLENAKQLLINAQKGLSGYESLSPFNLINSGNNVLVQSTNRNIRAAEEENENLQFVLPTEGSVIWVDNLCIPASASPARKTAAEKFINFLLQADIAAAVSEYNFQASPNQAAEALLSESFLANPTLYPPAEMLGQLQFIQPLGPIEEIYRQLWDEVKATAP